MREETSLWNEIRRLIGVRMSSKALQSNGKITFLRDGKEGEPLVYLRETEEERILILINPTDGACTVPFSGGEQIYLFGREPEYGEGKVTAAPKSAVFFRLQ